MSNDRIHFTVRMNEATFQVIRVVLLYPKNEILMENMFDKLATCNRFSDFQTFD